MLAGYREAIQETRRAAGRTERRRKSHTGPQATNHPGGTGAERTSGGDDHIFPARWREICVTHRSHKSKQERLRRLLSLWGMEIPFGDVIAMTG